MSKDRIVRGGIIKSDRVNLLSWAGEVFYRRLMSVVDDYGRYEGRPTILRADLYPLRIDKVSDADVVKWLAECSKAGLVSVYHVNGKEFLELKDFNQRLRQKVSKYPPPVDNSQQSADGVGRRRLEEEEEIEVEREGEVEKPPPKKNDDSTVFFNAEEIVLNNQIQFERICMSAKKNDVEAVKISLRKYHLHLEEKEKYPMTKKQIFAGFEKWLMNENQFINGAHKQNNGNIAGQKSGTSVDRIQALKDW